MKGIFVQRSPADRVLGAFLPYAGLLSGLLLVRSGWAAILGYHASMVVVLAAREGRGLFRLASRGFLAGKFACMSIACAAAGPLVWILWPVMRLPEPTLAEKLGALGLSGASWVGFVAYYGLVNPFLEEVYWRGWYAEDTWWPAPSDLLYTGYHAVVLLLFVEPPFVLLAVAVLLAAAWLWRQLARAAPGLLVPVCTHIVADVSIIAAAMVLVR